MQGLATGPKQQGIQPPGLGRCGKELAQQRQKGITRTEPTAELGDRLGTMPGLVPLEQDGPPRQVEAPLLQLGPQAVLSPAIADLQIGEAADQLAAQGEVAAKRTTAVVDEGEAHCAILNTALPLP